MRQSLHHSAVQQITMTPQLQHAIRLLQLSALEFEQEINQTVASNPFLEHEEELESAEGPLAPAEPAKEPSSEAEPAAAPAADTVPDSEDSGGESWGSSSSQRSEDDEADPTTTTPTQPTLREHLLGQLKATHMSIRDVALVTVLIEALDEHGYLRQPLAEIQAMLPAELSVEMEELMVALAFLQSMDPAGVGASSLAQCLELQLREFPQDEPGRALALNLVRQHLPLLAAHDTPRLMRVLQCDETALRQANALIRRLHPHPGEKFARDDVQYVVADVIVNKHKGRWIASINPEVVPRIQINRMYASILRRNRDANFAQLSRQLQEARWLIRNVRQRYQTIQRVAQAIVDRQSRFLDFGELAMKPLVLREIAEELDLHPSTVSRVTSNKYMSTPRGLIDFKYFFGRQLETDAGGTCSATAIRAVIREIIAKESNGAPLSDTKVAKILNVKGIHVARRTVAKYRNAMKIPPAEGRRMSAPQMQA
jgi:RNA polymerase sigma-54 factor